MTSSLFPVSATVSVRYRDLDPLGHVNNAVYASYLEWARVAYRLKLAEIEGREVPRELAATDIEYVIAQLTINYRSPAFLGEQLDIGIKVSSIGRTSFVYEYSITERDSGRLVATARSVQVMVDNETGDKKPVPDEFLNAIETLEDRPVPRH
ncbi:MAG: thioesterase family protein [Chloroflexota bacterium]|nr:thioesterase family protein [Chloroflexota bacterium]